MSIPNGPTRRDIVSETRTWLGTPYVHQACCKGEGTDCLGLVRGVYRHFYGEEPETPPPYTPDWVERQGDETLLRAAGDYLQKRKGNALVSGDVILFRVVQNGPAKHMGILSAEDRFIHAYAGRCVCESWLGRWWASRIVGLYSFPGVSS